MVYRGDVSVIHDEGGTSGGDYASGDNVRLFASRWGELLEPDDELLRTAFDAEANPLIDTGVRGARHPRGAELVVEGPPQRPLARGRRGPRPARRAGGGRATSRPAATWSTRPSALACARTSASVLTRALTRPARPLARTLRVEADAEPGMAAADPALLRRRGGEGVLAMLPAHDLERCRLLLQRNAPQRLGAHAPPHRPNGGTRGTRRGGAGPRQGARPDLLRAGFAELAGRYDAVLCADPDDVRQRRALIAAATGALPIVFEAGPATAVLGIDANTG